MIGLTYIMQGIAVALAGGALILMPMTIASGRWGLVAVQLVCVVANLGLFYWQSIIRASL